MTTPKTQPQTETLREKRMAAALRENLKKRKLQEQNRQAKDKDQK
jgi:hypothetical protein